MRYWSILFGVVGLACVACFAYAPFNPEWWLLGGPDPKVSHLRSPSTLGREIDALFVIILWITGVVFIGTQVALAWAAWKFADAPGRVAVYFHGSQRLELIWTIIPAIALVFITVYQFSTWANVKFKSREPNVSPIAEVTARQFQWMIRYPGPDKKFRTSDDLFTINDLHFVKDQKTLIHLMAKDVLHSFFLPELRVKQDAVPGLKISVWFDADQAGHYELVCAELCGWGHGKMRGNVTVHETQAEFDDWLKSVAREQDRDQVATAPASVAEGDEPTMSHEPTPDGHPHDHSSLEHDHIHPQPWNPLFRYVFSTDHKVIAIQFLISGLIFFVVGGLMAMAIRWQLAWPNSPMPLLNKALWADQGYRMPPEFYNKLFTMHGSVMIFFVIIPILVGAFGNFTIPLMIGARDMAFPKLNMLSYWCMPFAFVAMLNSFVVTGGSAEAGWTSYPPLANSPWSTPGSLEGQTWWLIGVLFAGLSSLMGSINYLTTILMLRAPGMKMFRMPMTVWAMFITSILQAFALPVLTSALVMQLLDRTVGTNFFSPPNWSVANGPPVVGGGQPLLWQHLFWFYSHPAVYIMILPAMGIVSDVISTFSRKPLFGYKPMVFAIGLIAGLGFIVWGHHMFQSGMNPALGATFMLSTMLIALPSAIKVFNWLGTIWGGRIQFTSAMLNALGFVSMFIIGGLSGIFMAATPVDMHIHDTYFIVAHIHYVLFGGSTFGIFAAIYYWFPKMFGRMMNERVGKIHFVLTFLTFNGTFFLMHIIGMHGHPRRIADPTIYPFLASAGVVGMNRFMTYSAFGLGLSQILFAGNFLYSLVLGPKAPANPWHANTLEWGTTSPPPYYNFETIPTVYHPAYEYSVPGVVGDYLPQTEPRPPLAGPMDPHHGVTSGLQQNGSRRFSDRMNPL